MRIRKAGGERGEDAKDGCRRQHIRHVERPCRGRRLVRQPQWIAGIYLAVGGGALAFILWVLALQRATPARVANTMTVNPIVAAPLAPRLVGEPHMPNLVVGLIAVLIGIWIATTKTRVT